jgi:hypothetical protein
MLTGKSDRAQDGLAKSNAEVSEKPAVISSKKVLSSLAQSNEEPSNVDAMTTTRNIPQSIVTIPFVEQVEQLMAEIAAHAAELPNDFKIMVFCPTSRFAGASAFQSIMVLSAV